MQIYVLFCTVFVTLLVFFSETTTTTLLARPNSRSACYIPFAARYRKINPDHMIAGCMAFTHWQPSRRGDISWSGKSIILYCSSPLKWKRMLKFLWDAYALVHVCSMSWIATKQCPTGDVTIDLRLKWISLLERKSRKFSFEKSYFLEGEKSVFSHFQNTPLPWPLHYSLE